MRVVVTGSREGRSDVVHWLRRFVAQHGVPELFILGCAPGVDTVARWLAGRMRWSHVVVYADESKPSPERYHDRNQRMVDLAEPGDWCLAFPVAGSRGTWDCVRRAQGRGLRAVQLPFNPPDAQRRRQSAPFGPLRED